MSCLIIVVLYSLLVSIHANFNVTRQMPNATLVVTNTTQSFMIEIDHLVNRPAFAALICVCNASTNLSVYQIDVYNSSNSTVNYSNFSLSFSLPASFYNTKNEFYITFDAGVFFSGSLNSTARNDSQFWHLRAIDVETTTTSGTTYLSSYTSISTTAASSVSHTDTSMSPMTTMPNISTTINQTVSAPITTTAIPTVGTNTGEPPPTRSAQLGMGLGITFISVAIIAEIIYFKYCYSGGERSGSYYT